MILPQRSVLEKGVDKDKIHEGKGKGNSLKKTSLKNKSKGNPLGNPMGKRGKSTQSNKTDGKGPKMWYPPARPGGRIQEKVERKTGKSGSKGKNHDGRSGGKAKKCQM